MERQPEHNTEDLGAVAPATSGGEGHAEFIGLFAQHHSQILAYIYRLVHDRHDADDLFQRASMVLWSKFDSFEPASNFLAWAKRIAYLQVCNFLRTSGRDRLRFSDEVLARLAAEPTVPNEESQRRLDALARCMKELGRGDRVTLLSVAPKPDGTLPDSQVNVLNRLGNWMRVNDDALRGADFRIPCEAGTLRFTRKGPWLYAIDLKEPTAPTIIPGVTPVQGSNIRMLGSDKDLAWRQVDGNVVIEEFPDPLPCDHAWVFRILVNDTTEEIRRHIPVTE